MRYELPDPPDGMEYLIVSIPVRKDEKFTKRSVESLARVAADEARRAARARMSGAAA
jgi:hypothetical protein